MSSSHLEVKWEPVELEEHQLEGICGQKGEGLTLKANREKPKLHKRNTKTSNGCFALLFIEGREGHARNSSRMESLVETGIILDDHFRSTDCEMQLSEGS